MTEIPEDVMKAARQCAVMMEHPSKEACGRNIDAIARAIMAERERCAAYVEYLTDEGSDGLDVDECADAFNNRPKAFMSARIHDHGQALAAAIRKGDGDE